MIQIRDFKKEDQGKVYKFCRQIFDELEWPIQYGEGLNDFSKAFKLPDGVFIVAWDENNVVGCGGVKPLVDKTGLIKRFFVASQLRGSGLAKDLLDLLIKKAKEKAFDTLVLDTGKGNVSANKFYSKHGFELFTPSDAMMREWKEAGESEKFNYYLMKLS